MAPATITWSRADETPGRHRLALDEQAGPVLIGRDAVAAVRVQDNNVSRVHAELTPVGGVWMIEDVGSAGGTFLMRTVQRPLKVAGRRRLLHDDRIRVGRTILTYLQPPVPGEVAGTELLGHGTTIAPTPREHEVLRLLCADELHGRGGWPSNDDLAAALYVSEHTIRTHMQSLFAKFGLERAPVQQKRAMLIGRAISEGWVP
jgi:DNA-binding CsgD family transcriptional regulator